MKSAIVSGLFLCLISCDNVFAQWSIDVNKDDSVCTAIGQQWYPHFISDGKGGAFISWIDYRSNMARIYAQWVDKNGVNRWVKDGIDISPGQSLEWSQYTMISDSCGGFLLVYGSEFFYDHYLERIDSNGSIVWNIDPDQFYHLHTFEAITDGRGGAYFLYSSYQGDSTYFVHFNESGFNITPNGKKLITTTDNGVTGKIMINNSSSLLIATESVAAGYLTLICLTDTLGNILSSTTALGDDRVEWLQKGSNDDVYMVTTGESSNGYNDYSASIRFFRIVDSPALSVSYLGWDGGWGNGPVSANLYKFLPGDSDHLYFSYYAGGVGNLARAKKDGSNFSIVKVPNLGDICPDGEDGFYSGLRNNIYHFASSDSASFSDTVLFSNSGVVWNSTVIMSDELQGCLIAFAKEPSSDFNIYSKHYPSSGMVVGTPNETSLSSQEISVFPNPTLSDLTLVLSAGVTEILVLNLLGETKLAMKTSDKNLQLNLSSLTTGTYFVQVRTKEFSQTIKVEKE